MAINRKDITDSGWNIFDIKSMEDKPAYCNLFYDKITKKERLVILIFLEKESKCLFILQDESKGDILYHGYIENKEELVEIGNKYIPSGFIKI
jgi:hypothetical protein